MRIQSIIGLIVVVIVHTFYTMHTTCVLLNSTPSAHMFLKFNIKTHTVQKYLHLLTSFDLWSEKNCVECTIVFLLLLYFLSSLYCYSESVSYCTYLYVYVHCKNGLLSNTHAIFRIKTPIPDEIECATRSRTRFTRTAIVQSTQLREWSLLYNTLAEVRVSRLCCRTKCYARAYE